MRHFDALIEEKVGVTTFVVCRSGKSIESGKNIVDKLTNKRKFLFISVLGNDIYKIACGEMRYKYDKILDQFEDKKYKPCIISKILPRWLK